MATKEELLGAAFIRDPRLEISSAISTAVLAEMNKPGFMRTYFFHRDNHTVEEFTKREDNIARRIYRRANRLSMRQIVRQLRQHNI